MRLDDEVDVVVSGHSHGFTNALVKNANGKPILVTQAFSSSTAYGDIDLEISRAARRGREVGAHRHHLRRCGPGFVPDTAAAQLTAAAEAAGRAAGQSGGRHRRRRSHPRETAAGESALGNLIADAQRAALGTDFAFMNPGGIRADIAAGEVTWGELFTVQPFGNTLVQDGSHRPAGLRPARAAVGRADVRAHLEDLRPQLHLECRGTGRQPHCGRFGMAR